MKYVQIATFIFLFFAISILTGFLYAHAIGKNIVFTPIIINNNKTSPQKQTVPTSPTKQDLLPAPEQLFEKSPDTPSTQSRSFRFVVLADSDNYTAPSGHNDILPHILATSQKLSPDFAIFSGDLITMPEPSTSRVRDLKKLIETYYKKYYIAFGKHDIECGTACVRVWQKEFFDIPSTSEDSTPLYHAFDHENTHFILLSSDYPLKHGVDDTQLTWLENDLKKTDKKNIIVISHVPPVNFFEESTEECHDMTCDESRRTRLVSLLEKYGVDLVISGHEHSFDHKIVNKIDYLLAGNIGNGKRYKDTVWKNSFLHIIVTQEHINVKSLDENGGLIREIAVPL